MDYWAERTVDGNVEDCCTNMKRAIALTLSMAAVGFDSVTAEAQTTAQNIAAAEALFNDAVKLTEAGNYADACPKFEASLKLAKTTNTILRLADCDEKIGKFASAYGLYLEGAEELKKAKDKRENIVRTRVEALRPRLS